MQAMNYASLLGKSQLQGTSMISLLNQIIPILGKENKKDLLKEEFLPHKNKKV
jgi:hypothetical protein